jgi:hypothetical protein
MDYSWGNRLGLQMMPPMYVYCRQRSCSSFFKNTLFIYLFYSFIHMYIHFSTLPLPPASPLTLPSLPGRTCSALISNFVEEK